MKRIICVGNRYRPPDDTGPRVYDRLIRRRLPEGVTAVDGGLAGLDLARFVEGAERVVFVDAVSGFRGEAGVVVLPGEAVAALAGARYDHAAGLPYLLRMLPSVCDGPLPEMAVVGIEGDADERLVESAADAALRVAAGGDDGAVFEGEPRINADELERRPASDPLPQPSPFTCVRSRP